ncbi:MAG: GYF domain-containing protein [Pirellulales bacterium]
MPIVVHCPACGREIRANDNLAGLIVACPDCRQAVAVPPPAPASSTFPPAATPLRPVQRVFADAPSPHQPTRPSPPAASRPSFPAASSASPPESDPHLPPASSGQIWYVKTPDGQTLGPMSRERLNEWAVSAGFAPNSLIWSEGSTLSVWAGEMFAYLVPNTPPIPDKVEAGVLNADAFEARPRPDERAIKRNRRRQRHRQRRAERRAEWLRAIPSWIWTGLVVLGLLLVSMLVSAFFAEMSIGLARLWALAGILIYFIAFVMFWFAVHEDDWFWSFLLLIERLVMLMMVLALLLPAVERGMLAMPDNSFQARVVFYATFFSAMSIPNAFIPIPLFSLWYIATHWDEVWPCLLFQVLGTICWLLVPLLLLVSAGGTSSGLL